MFIKWKCGCYINFSFTGDGRSNYNLNSFRTTRWCNLLCIKMAFTFNIVLYFTLYWNGISTSYYILYCFLVFVLIYFFYLYLNDIHIFRDSAPHHSEAPARYLNKMTSILKEKVEIPQLWSWLSWSCWLLWSRLSSCWCSRINDQGHGHCSWDDSSSSS